MPENRLDRAPAERTRPDRGLELIIGYKLIKGAAWLFIALALLILILAGEGPELQALTVELHRHVTAAWSLRLADLVSSAVEPRHVLMASAALGLDGTLTLLEGWALSRGFRWGPWLVVAATSALLPFEITAVVHGLRPGRLVLLTLNLAIVLYLVRRAVHHRNHRRRTPPDHASRANAVD